MPARNLRGARGTGSFRGDRSGVTATIFALTLLPLAAALGLGIDYGLMSQAQTRLSMAANASVLAATMSAMNTYAADSHRDYIKAGVDTGTNWFRDQTVGKLGNAIVGEGYPDIKIVQTGTTFDGTLIYKATVPTIFGRMLGVSTLAIGGTAKATATLPGYLDLHILMDLSSSMDIIASTNDFANFVNIVKTKYNDVYKSKGQSSACTFACHYKAGSEGPSLHDIAIQYGVQRRIDVMRSAVRNVIQKLSSSEAPQNYQVGMYGFNYQYQTLFTLSHDLDSAAKAASQIDTPVTSKSTKDTYFEGAMTALTPVISTSGDGEAATEPKEVLFIITDGVDNYAGNSPQVTAFNPQYCSDLKKKGVNIFVLNTQYYPVYTTLPPPDGTGRLNVTYQNEVVPIINDVQPALKACASSSSNFFMASDGASIDAALQKMLQASVATPGRYTQ